MMCREEEILNCRDQEGLHSPGPGPLVRFDEDQEGLHSPGPGPLVRFYEDQANTERSLLIGCFRPSRGPHNGTNGNSFPEPNRA